MAATGLEEKYDAVRQLIAIGKERGYLLYDEVNDSLPAEVHLRKRSTTFSPHLSATESRFTRTPLRPRLRARSKCPPIMATATRL